MRRKYLRFEQMEVFRPMPVTQQMRERIRQEAQKAKALEQCRSNSDLDRLGELSECNIKGCK